MWYVIQTMSGKEHEVCLWINTYIDRRFYKRCFVPLFEDVWRQGGIAHSDIKRLFPGYLFIETEEPDKVYESLKKILKFAVILSMGDNSNKVFLPLEKDEEIFFDTILSDGLMRVSYIHKNKAGKLDMVIGPLESYTDYMIELNSGHRRATVKIPILGEERKVKFGLWLDSDPKIEWIEKEKQNRVCAQQNNIEENLPKDHWDWKAWKNIRKTIGDKKKDNYENIYGYTVGDYVINITGIYGNTPLEVTEILPDKNSVKVNAMLFGGITQVEMKAEDVILVEEE